VECSADTSGLIRFPVPSGNVFYLVAGNNGVEEGGYGTMTGGTSRPEATGLAAACDYPRDLIGNCDGTGFTLAGR